MDWTDLGQDRDRRQVLMSAVMNLRAPYNAGEFDWLRTNQLLKKDSAPCNK